MFVSNTCHEILMVLMYLSYACFILSLLDDRLLGLRVYIYRTVVPYLNNSLLLVADSCKQHLWRKLLMYFYQFTVYAMYLLATRVGMFLSQCLSGRLNQVASHIFIFLDFSSGHLFPVLGIVLILYKHYLCLNA